MNNGLYFTVTLVVLAWLSVSTCSSSTSTTSATKVTVTSNNMTTPTTMTSAATTTAAPPLVYNDTVTALTVGGVDLFEAN